MKSVRLLVFLRTDLYELYDIQEKTKLVSRMVTLEWSEEDWLRLLVNRVLANPPLQSLAETLRGPGGIVDLRAALEALFPAEIEGQHVERWLVDSIRNGKGAVSPRLAVLLLYKTRDFSRRPDDVISRLPLFDGDAVRAAMTHLSKLSYEEIVDDFKVASSFVRNCRAGGLASFALDDVRHHFDADEGEVNEQVQLLERLGFLERVVIEGETATSAHFRTPSSTPAAGTTPDRRGSGPASPDAGRAAPATPAVAAAPGRGSAKRRADYKRSVRAGKA